MTIASDRLPAVSSSEPRGLESGLASAIRPVVRAIPRHLRVPMVAVLILATLATIGGTWWAMDQNRTAAVLNDLNLRYLNKKIFINTSHSRKPMLVVGVGIHDGDGMLQVEVDGTRVWLQANGVTAIDRTGP